MFSKLRNDLYSCQKPIKCPGPHLNMIIWRPPPEFSETTPTIHNNATGFSLESKLNGELMAALTYFDVIAECLQRKHNTHFSDMLMLQRLSLMAAIEGGMTPRCRLRGASVPCTLAWVGGEWWDKDARTSLWEEGRCVKEHELQRLAVDPSAKNHCWPTISPRLQQGSILRYWSR